MKNWIVALLLFALAGGAWAGFEEGRVAYIKKDYKTALLEWRPLAEKGDADAQAFLGLMYDQGQGVVQDFKEAVRWYRLAAAQGNALAQNNLGGMYEFGIGVPVSHVAAYALYNIAAANDSSSSNKASANRERVVQTMTRSQVVAGQELTRRMQGGNPIQALDAWLKTAAKK